MSRHFAHGAHGLRAFLYGSNPAEPARLPDDHLTPDAAASITAWADADADLGGLAGCFCGCEAGPRPPMPAEACTELGAQPAAPRLGLLRRAHIALLRRRLDIVIDEHDRYAAVGAIGPVYEHNSRLLQLQLMARIRELQGLPATLLETLP